MALLDHDLAARTDSIAPHRSRETPDPEPWLVRLEEGLAALEPTSSPGARLEALLAEGLDRLPLPGRGRTLDRFRALALVGGHDLALAKVYEGHVDALAILAELGASEPPSGSTLGTWAAESAGMRLVAKRVDAAAADGIDVRLSGRKPWCSAAPTSSHALVTVHDGSEQSVALVALRQPGVRVTTDGFYATGMASTASVDVVFDGARASLVGRRGEYLGRAGFWHGAVGVAACWYGGAAALGKALARRVMRRDDPFARAHLGAVDVALGGASLLLHDAAARIDEQPFADARRLALRVRAGVEQAATAVLEHVGRALGAAPFCRDADFGRMAADLPVYIRQSHAEHDLAALGELVAADTSWDL